MDEAFRELRNYARNNGTRRTQVARDLADGHLDPNLILTGLPGRGVVAAARVCERCRLRNPRGRPDCARR